MAKKTGLIPPRAVLNPSIHRRVLFCAIRYNAAMSIDDIQFFGGPWDGMKVQVPSRGDLPDKTEILASRPFGDVRPGSYCYRSESDAGNVVFRYVGRSPIDLPPGSRFALPDLE
jgi:hypothetical protein